MVHRDTLGENVMELWILVGILYFFPAMIAKARKHPNTAAIFVLNIFLGWTFIGWVVALVWAVTNPQH